jgi:extracellular factor (EF) 3-hydroxypalmitic acid methyl ester biosynthesis protein
MRRHSLSSLLKNDWTILSLRARSLTFGLGYEIIRAGSRIDSIYVIRSGSASVELPTVRSTRSLALLEPGDICGELAFLDNGTATAAVVAKDTEVSVDAIHVCDLHELCREIPGFGFRLYQSLAISVAERLKSTLAEVIRNG